MLTFHKPSKLAFDVLDAELLKEARCEDTLSKGKFEDSFELVIETTDTQTFELEVGRYDCVLSRVPS